MYTISNFGDKTFGAISVPPPAHEALPEDFQNLSRIHFSLGREPIDAMIKAVQNASLEDIYKGRVQLYFASKMIQDFLSRSHADIDYSDNKFNPSIYFDQSFSSILKHTKEVLNEVYVKPTRKQNKSAVEVMVGLVHEVTYFNELLSGQGIKTADISHDIGEVKDLYAKVYGLKTHYDALSELKDFDSYKEDAQKSVVAQLEVQDRFDFSELAHIYTDYDDWMPTLHRLLKDNDDVDNGLHAINLHEAEELKERSVRQLSGFNQLLQNGVVNYVNSYAAELSRQIFYTAQRSMVSAENYYQRELSQLKRFKKLRAGKDYAAYDLEIAEFEANKDSFIAQKVQDKVFFEEQLTSLNRQQVNIQRTLDKVRAKVLNIELKETITFEGDIKTGFVIGTPSVGDKVMLIHKDPFVSVPEAVYAMVIDKDRYEELVRTNSLVFTEEFRESEFSSSSNFWSYGQFLQEVSDPGIQKHFIGREFDLIDHTLLVESKPTAKKKVDIEMDDIPY